MPLPITDTTIVALTGSGKKKVSKNIFPFPSGEHFISPA